MPKMPKKPRIFGILDIFGFVGIFSFYGHVTSVDAEPELLPGFVSVPEAVIVSEIENEVLQVNAAGAWM